MFEVVKPVRLTFPTTSVAPVEVAAAGIVKILAPVNKSPLAKFKTPVTVESAPSVAPAALLIVSFVKLTLPEVDWADEPSNETTPEPEMAPPLFVITTPEPKSENVVAAAGRSSVPPLSIPMRFIA